MRDRERHEKLSRLRGALLALLEHLRELLNVALARTPLVKGNVYEIARRCGTPNCRCTRGRLHRNMVLTWSEQGRSHMRSIPPRPSSRTASEECRVFALSSGPRRGLGAAQEDPEGAGSDSGVASRGTWR